jgi:hypothetical protein
MEMRRRWKTGIALAAFLLSGAAGPAPAASGQDGELLKADCVIAPSRLSRGQSGKAVIRFAVRDGVEISPHPDFVIEFSPGPELVFAKNFFTARDLGIAVDEKDGGEALSLARTVEIPFTVSVDARRGTHRLQGRVRYFARSRSENWCVKETVRFAASYYTRSTLVRKAEG